MGLEHFIARQRLVLHGGRRYLCRRPPFGVVLRFLELYKAEIMACAQHVDAAMERAAMVDACLPFFVRPWHGKQDPRAGELLEQCVTAGEGPGFVWQAASGDPELAELLARAVLSLADFDAILRMVTLPTQEAPAAEPGDASPSDDQLTGFLVMTTTIGVSPSEVYGWPAEAIEAVNHCLPDLLQILRPIPGSAQGGRQANWSRSALAAMPGISVSKVTH
jgi:hypothetical protein